MMRETQEQIALMEWAEIMTAKHPELRLLYHIPNGGRRSKIEGVQLRRSGVKAGVPDLCLPVTKGGYNSLYIELKVHPNKPTPNQRQWLTDLTAAGSKTAVCYGWTDAAAVITEYLEDNR